MLKPELALVFRSAQGSGKTLFFDYIGCMLIGRSHYKKFASVTRFLSKFNLDSAGRRLILLDEANMTAGDGWDINADAMKSEITSTERAVEGKGANTVTVDDFAAIIMCTNRPEPVDIEAGDRRHMLSDASNKHCKDFPYFEKMAQTLGSYAGASSVMSYLMSVDIENFRPGEMPKTALKDACAANSLPPPGKFWLDKLEAATKEEAEAEQTWPAGALTAEYKGFCSENNLKPGRDGVFKEYTCKFIELKIVMRGKEYSGKLNAFKAML
jgi:hypothetical protein